MHCALALSAIVFVVATSSIARAQDLRTDERPEQDEPPPVSSSGITVPLNRGLFNEPRVLEDAIKRGFDRFGDSGTPGNGFYLELSNMITGSGWVSPAPGFRRNIAGGAGFVDTSAAISWHAYTMLQGRIEFPDLANKHLAFGSQVMWQDQTQINYFGIGSASLQSNESQYRMQSIDSVLYASIKPVKSLTFGGEYGFLRRPEILTQRRVQAFPTTPELFPADPGVADSFQPNYLHGEASVTS
jgi:hypothetical protein